MCLWGVVDGEESSSTSQSSPTFAASTAGVTNDDVDDHLRYGGGGGDGCPLLTESALLRTMDAIQSAAAAAAAHCGGSGGNDLARAASAESSSALPCAVTTQPNLKSQNSSNPTMIALVAVPTDAIGTGDDHLKRKDRPQEPQQRRQKQRRMSGAIDGDANNDGLFFIDRVGDQAATAMNERQGVAVEIVDLSNDDNADATTTTTSNLGRGNRVALATMFNELDHTKSAGGDVISEQSTISAAAESASAVASVAAASFLTEDFQFAIDEEGMKELGGYDDDGEEVMAAVDLSKSATCVDNNDAPETVKQADTGHSEGGEASSSSNVVFIVEKFEQGAIVNINDDGSDDDDDVDGVDVIIVGSDGKEDDDDDDSADKLSSYYQRRDHFAPTTGGQNYDRRDVTGRASGLSSVVLLDHDDSSEEKEYLGQDSSDSSDSDTDIGFLPRSKTITPKQSMEVLELSLTSNKNSDTDLRQQQPAVVGPRGKARARVISALLRLTRQLRMSSKFTHTIECRTKARVALARKDDVSYSPGFEGCGLIFNKLRVDC